MMLKIITPERTFFEGMTEFVEFTTEEGPMGIYPRHEAVTVMLAPGVLHIYQEGVEKKAAMHAGFAMILPEEITILAEIAEWPEEIDLNRANEARIRAERKIREDGSTMREELALRRALARIEIAK